MTESAPRDLNSEVQQLQEQIASLQQQLLQAQRLGSVGELASSITHEFNNILTTVINYAKLGLRHQDPAQRDKAFEKILSAGQRAAKITTGLLSYARGRNSRRESQSLARLVQDVLLLIEKDLQSHRVTLEFRCDGTPYASLNASEVQQVVLNLLINARQAMPQGGSLTVLVQDNATEGWSEIVIQDSGSGIPAEQLPHIFTRFFSTKTPDARGQGGSGLGLALCKQIVDAHGGRIRVESAPGRGTRFTLKFPPAAPPNLLSVAGVAAPATRPSPHARAESVPF